MSRAAIKIVVSNIFVVNNQKQEITRPLKSIQINLAYSIFAIKVKMIKIRKTSLRCNQNFKRKIPLPFQVHVNTTQLLILSPVLHLTNLVSSVKINNLISHKIFPKGHGVINMSPFHAHLFHLAVLVTLWGKLLNRVSHEATLRLWNN